MAAKSLQVRELNGAKNAKGPAKTGPLRIRMVGVTGIEPVTPTMSTLFSRLNRAKYG
jgi:hypothetical protein